MEKTVSLVTAASGEVKDVSISPGATVREVLNEAGLDGYNLSKKGGGEPLDPSSDLFEAAADGEKFFCTPRDVSVGDGGSASFSKLTGFIKGVSNLIRYRNLYDIDKQEELERFRIKKVKVINSRSLGAQIQSGRARLMGRRKYKKKEPRVVGTDKEHPYWKGNGWKRIGKKYKGYYKTDYGKWRGLIEEDFRYSYSFYIIDPPKVLFTGPHETCFMPRGNGKYKIHFSHKPVDISSGIVIVEQIIRESFE